MTDELDLPGSYIDLLERIGRGVSIEPVGLPTRKTASKTAIAAGSPTGKKKKRRRLAVGPKGY